MPQTNKAWIAIIIAMGIAVSFYDVRAALGAFALAGFFWIIDRTGG